MPSLIRWPLFSYERDDRMTTDASCVFICTGNMCRSPFAEHFFRKLSPQLNHVSSMGLAALPGRLATPASVRAALRFGVDLTVHRTRSIEEDVLRHASGIYVFEHMHRDNIGQLFPEFAPKVHLLGSLVGTQDYEIPDPAGGPESGIARCYEVIEKA